jgi:hypothetical protein
MPEVTRLNWNDGELRRILDGPNGEVARYLGRMALRVQGQAKINASGMFHGRWSGHGTGRPSAPGSGDGPGVRTGRLRNSITWRIDESVSGVAAIVGTNVEYAGYLERGTRHMPGGYPFLKPALRVLG